MVGAADPVDFVARLRRVHAVRPLRKDVDRRAGRRGRVGAAAQTADVHVVLLHVHRGQRGVVTTAVHAWPDRLCGARICCLDEVEDK